METSNHLGISKVCTKPSNTSLNSEQRELYLRLFLAKGIGSQRAKTLVEHFKNIEDIFGATQGDWELTGLNINLKKELENQFTQSKALKELEAFDQSDAKQIFYWEDEFPLNLKQSPFCPLMVYAKGDYLKSDALSIGLVGTRSPTDYGQVHTKWIANLLCEMGITIVSGLAMGIDRIAHRAALNHKTRTIATLGQGFSANTSKALKEWIEHIAQNGVVYSQFSLTENASTFTFPQRNRVLSGLSQGMILTESRRTGGAMITAKHALEEGKELFCLLGPIDSECSEGPNLFASQGAICIFDKEDLKKNLHSFFDRKFLGPMLKHSSIFQQNTESQLDNLLEIETIAPPQLNEFEAKILSFLTPTPMSFDKIIEKSQLKIPLSLRTLSSLELKGLIRSLAGGSYASNNYI